MRITFLGNHSASHTSESHHAKALEALGHEVIKLQEGNTPGWRISMEALQSDMFVWVHSHGFAPTSDGVPIDQTLQNCLKRKIPSVAYHLDLYLGIPARWKQYETDPYITGGWMQHFFTVDSLMADWLNAHTDTKGHWLPPGVDKQECYMAKPRDVFDVAFVGSRNYHPEWPERPKLINFLEAHYAHRFKGYGSDFGRPVRGDALNQVYANAKVVVGDSFCPGHDYQGHYWSDRAPETLGRGGFLLHPRVPYMEDVFADKKHLVYYDFDDYDQLVKLIDHYLRNDVEREQIRRQGHEYVKKHHTYTERWQAIIDQIRADA